MSSKGSSVLLWVFSFIFMAVIAVYQRMTGPTYPIRTETRIDGQDYKAKLLTSSDSEGDALVEINLPDTSVSGYYEYKRFKSLDNWTQMPLQRQGDKLIAALPHQPPAGKVMYNISLEKEGRQYKLTNDPVVLRFKGSVPLYILIPHILLMFLAMVFSTRTGIEAIAKRTKTFRFSLWTTVFLFLGGLILGPLVQYHAFGAFWTGWPFGHDLTDNKTLIALIFWIIALIRLKKQPGSRAWAVAAALILLAVYLVPHSVLGSEIDYTQAVQK